MCNTMECKKDSFNSALGRAKETHLELVSVEYVDGCVEILIKNEKNNKILVQ